MNSRRLEQLYTIHHTFVPLLFIPIIFRQNNQAWIRMQLDNSAKKKVGPVNNQDFKAVIPVGYGEKSVNHPSRRKMILCLRVNWQYSLYPLNQGTHVVSKALLPIGNVPVINLVLDWVLESGLRGTQLEDNKGRYW